MLFVALALQLTSFDTPGAALESLLAKKPRVIAFGEFHELKGAAKVHSAIWRFREQLLASVQPIASDLIVETWVTDGKCGKTEEKAVAQVQESTKRPESTEDEVMALLRTAKERGVQPHVLTVSCAQYKAIGGDGGEIDYVKLLETVTTVLRTKIHEVLGLRKGGDKTVLVYGGAIHNDVYPKKELRDFSFARDITKATHERYLEVDLYVPEYIAGDKDLTAEPWYKPYLEQPPAKTTLVRRGPTSFIIIFPRTSA
jgi:hypothetical protein